MNRHFKDTRYYLKRAVETAIEGIAEELTPVEHRLRTAIGRQKTETGRLDDVKADLRDAQGKAEGEAKEAIAGARRRIETYRKTES